MRVRRLLLFAGFLGAVACRDASAPAGPPARIDALPRELSSSESAVIAAANSFGFNLLREVNVAFADSNVFLSPLSASMALGMAMNGAVGPTFDEMRSTLGFGALTYDAINASYQSLIALLRGLDNHVDFRIANAIYYRSSFGPAVEPTFLSDAQHFFDAEVAALDFDAPQSVTTVNDWAKTKTNGKITKVVDALSSELVMLLLNAIYFKGDWREAFDASETRNQPFTTLAGANVSVPTMHRKGGFRLGRTVDADVIELPYGGDAYAMTILLPKPGVSVNTLTASLTPARWAAATADVQNVDYDLYLPKFRLAWSDSLNDELQRMGMRTPFIGDVADFSRLSRSAGPHLYISFVNQKAFVDVNEVGTEAAAVTSVGIGVTSLPPELRVNRPFIFALRERLSGTILFMGKIGDPRG